MNIFYGGIIAFGNMIGWLSAEITQKAPPGWKKSVGLLQMGLAIVIIDLLVDQTGCSLFLASTLATFAMNFVLHKWVWRHRQP